MNKKFPSLHLNADDFIPATKDEKESLVVMRDSVNFWQTVCAACARTR